MPNERKGTLKNNLKMGCTFARDKWTVSESQTHTRREITGVIARTDLKTRSPQCGIERDGERTVSLSGHSRTSIGPVSNHKTSPDEGLKRKSAFVCKRQPSRPTNQSFGYPTVWRDHWGA